MDTAKRLLVHYLMLAWKAVNLHWDSDNRSEIESIIDEIEAWGNDQHLEAMRRTRELEDTVSKLQHRIEALESTVQEYDQEMYL